jgi:SAM-dependent methyltransferase
MHMLWGKISYTRRYPRLHIAHTEEGICRANRDYHDRHASTYEKDPHTNFMFFGACQSRIEEVVRWAAKQTPAELSLDIGCGTGNVLKFQVTHFKKAIGIDLSAAMMKLIPESPACLLLAEGTASPFSDLSFDFVSAFSVLHHLFEPVHLIREAYRILRPGGIFYSDWDFNNRFRTRALFSLWLHNLNPLKAFKGFIDHFILKDEESRLFTMAEYHAFKDWLDAEALAESARNIGFSKVYLIYHWNQPTIIGEDNRPKLPFPTGLIPFVTISFNPRVAFPIFSLIAIR